MNPSLPDRDFLLLILSSPSGAGKTTLTRKLLNEHPELRFSVSHTTRAPRPNEVDGRDYHFVDRAKFQALVAQGAFLEWAEVHGNCYGTLRREVDPYRAQGIGVILDIDVQGAEQVRRVCPDNVSIFLRAPSMDVYEQRLRGRHTEDEAAIARRLANARRELERVGEYDYVVVNDDLAVAVATVCDLIARQFAKG